MTKHEIIIMEPLKQFARIKKVPYATANIQDKLVMVYRKIDAWHSETGIWVWRQALDFFITTPLKHELSLKYFKYEISKYANDNSVTDRYRADSILVLFNKYGKINNPAEVAKEVYGERYVEIQKEMISSIVEVAKLGLKNQNIDKKSWLKDVLKEHSKLGINQELKTALSVI